MKKVKSNVKKAKGYVTSKRYTGVCSRKSTTKRLPNGSFVESFFARLRDENDNQQRIFVGSSIDGFTAANAFLRRAELIAEVKSKKDVWISRSNVIASVSF